MTFGRRFPAAAGRSGIFPVFMRGLPGFSNSGGGRREAEEARTALGFVKDIWVFLFALLSVSRSPSGGGRLLMDGEIGEGYPGTSYIGETGGTTRRRRTMGS